MGTFYRSQHELVFVFKVGTAKHINNFGLGERGRYRSNVWVYPGVNSFRRDRMEELEAHPTVKPLAMVIDAVKDCSRRGGIVLDPFVGSAWQQVATTRRSNSRGKRTRNVPRVHRPGRSWNAWRATHRSS